MKDTKGERKDILDDILRETNIMQYYLLHIYVLVPYINIIDSIKEDGVMFTSKFPFKCSGRIFHIDPFKPTLSETHFHSNIQKICSDERMYVI